VPHKKTLKRSLLAIPGNEAELAKEASVTDADEIFLDLEDSLARNEKNPARDELMNIVRENNWNDKIVSYRINSVGTRWWHKDIIDVIERVGGEIDTVIVPKVQSSSEIETVDSVIKAVEMDNDLNVGSIKISAHIETAKGMGAISEIAHASDRLNALMFGQSDYAVSIGALHEYEDYPGHFWHHPLSRISRVAAAANLFAISGVYMGNNTSRDFQDVCKFEAALGFDGKIVVHPEQIETANRRFLPSEEDFQRAKKIVEKYESTSVKDIATIDGILIDDQMYKMAKRIKYRADMSNEF